MPPTPKRLPKTEFQSRFTRTAKTPYFSLRGKKNTIQRVRIGVVVGKSIHKSAVKRNFWRRQTKAVLADLIMPGNDLLIIFFPKINKLTKQAFREALTRAIALL